MQTVIGAFDTRAHAEKAMQQLVQDGFDRDDVHLEEHDESAQPGMTGSSSTMQDQQPQGSIGHFFAHLFGTGDNEQHRSHAETYGEAVRRGKSVVVVDADDNAQAERAVNCLYDAGAINVDEQASQWRSEGWTGGATAAGAARPMMGSDTAPRTNISSGLRDDAPPVGKEGVLDVVQEELQVGKRSLDKGGVRVVQRVTEKPVREVVRLREEHAVVDRRPVDRPAQPGDMNAFREGTLEVRESAEEAVVGKTARVVEEVRVGKEVREREETVEDRVRRKDVDVDRIGGEQRERAVASNTGHTLAGERDPEASSTKLRKNDPLS
jgi:uncharacterized protein (TIGR02271 family)